MPTGAAALKRDIAVDWLLQRAGYPGARGIFDAAGSFLAAVAQPGLRAAPYRMIEGLPGIQNLGPMTDRLGRHGVGVGISGHGVRDELIFDPGHLGGAGGGECRDRAQGRQYGAKPASFPKNYAQISRSTPCSAMSCTRRPGS